jgi:hypothetical protein
MAYTAEVARLDARERQLRLAMLDAIRTFVAGLEERGPK